jgi:SAM-dependent methyltransferase
VQGVFSVAAQAYDRYMGRYSQPLAPQFAAFAGVERGQRALDVGCGPGALTSELVGRLGAEAVAAVDPSESFVDAARERHPGVDVRLGAAERLPFDDGGFDVSLAQLVVHFMADPQEGLSEMTRVTREGGTVAACVWDHGGGEGPLSPFWRVACKFDPHANDESDLAGATSGDLGRLFRRVGLTEVEETVLSVSVEHASFDDWWEPFTFGVGPAGAYLAQLEPEHRDRLRDALRRGFPPDGLTLTPRAWAARGRA